MRDLKCQQDRVDHARRRFGYSLWFSVARHSIQATTKLEPLVNPLGGTLVLRQGVAPGQPRSSPWAATAARPQVRGIGPPHTVSAVNTKTKTKTPLPSGSGLTTAESCQRRCAARAVSPTMIGGKRRLWWPTPRCLVATATRAAATRARPSKIARRLHSVVLRTLLLQSCETSADARWPGQCCPSKATSWLSAYVVQLTPTVVRVVEKAR